MLPLETPLAFERMLFILICHSKAADWGWEEKLDDEVGMALNVFMPRRVIRMHFMALPRLLDASGPGAEVLLLASR